MLIRKLRVSFGGKFVQVYKQVKSSSMVIKKTHKNYDWQLTNGRKQDSRIAKIG